MIPKALQAEVSKWIQSYPYTSDAMVLSNAQYEKAKLYVLRGLAKKYDFDLDTLINYYKL